MKDNLTEELTYRKCKHFNTTSRKTKEAIKAMNQVQAAWGKGSKKKRVLRK